MPHIIIQDTAPIVIPDQLGLSRLPPRPVEHRQARYHEQFDSRTLVYDAFDVPQLEQVALICPAFLNLEPLVRGLRFRTARGARLTPRVRTFIRNSQVWLRRRKAIDWLHPRSAIDKIVIEGGLEHDLAVGRNYCDYFTNKRVLFTLSRNNDLMWITDWISFYVDNHGSDAVLIYDNQSDAYTIKDLLDHVARSNLVDTCIVVDWPFKYGPDGGPADMWDSAFCQMGMLEHARWRFLANAKSVLNVDIDELLVCPGGEGIFAKVERSKGGYIRFPGRWISNVTAKHSTLEFSSRRHKEFLHLDVDAPSCSHKWACVPSRIRQKDQWCVHEILCCDDPTWKEEQFFFRHFRAINTDWKYRRLYEQKPEPSKHILDHALIEAFAGMAVDRGCH